MDISFSDTKNPDWKKQGFTLIELLVALSIIGILSSMAVPRFTRMKIRSTVTATKQTLSTMANAVQMFQIDHGNYPASLRFDSRYDLMPLVTASSFLQDISMPDPFQRAYSDVQLENDVNPNQGLGVQEDHKKHGFIYVNYRDFLGREFSRYHGIGLYSIGPDCRDSWLSLHPLPQDTQYLIRRKLYSVYQENAFQPVVVYNPSNGIYSGGDFGAFRGEFNGFVPSDI